MVHLSYTSREAILGSVELDRGRLPPKNVVLPESSFDTNAISIANQSNAPR